MIEMLTIPGKLPTNNEYINAARTNRFKAASLKRKTQDAIRWHMKKLPQFKGHVYVGFIWVRPDARSDKDNVAFAKKFILDALQEELVIEKDSWKLCTPFDLGYLIDKEYPRTQVIITDNLHELGGFIE